MKVYNDNFTMQDFKRITTDKKGRFLFDWQAIAFFDDWSDSELDTLTDVLGELFPEGLSLGKLSDYWRYNQDTLRQAVGMQIDTED